MSQETIWAPLVQELDRWRAAGRVATLWLRDDDAVAPSAALDRLLDLTGRHGLPVTLAVIPEHTGQALVRRLDEAPEVEVAVHGWSHHNHAPDGEKKQELGKHRPKDMVLAELDAGFRRLAQLHADRFVPMLVPPWNRIDAALVPDLPQAGYKALSVFGAEKPGTLTMINTHVDLMDWHGTKGGRAHGVLAGEIAARLRTTFTSGGIAGILGHHLVHDETAWQFLEALFAITGRHPACAWRAASDLI